MSLEQVYNESNVKAKTRLKIIQQAVALLVANEFDKVTMTDIANACGITQRNLYRYYKNKDFLIMDAIYYCVYKSAFYRTPVSVKELSKNGIGMLRDVLDALTLRHEADSELFRSIKLMGKFDYYLNTLDKDNPAFVRYVQEYVVDFNVEVRQDLNTALRRGLQDGSIRPFSDDVSVMSEYIFQSSSALFTRILNKSTERKLFSFELVNRHIEMIIAALTSL